MNRILISSLALAGIIALPAVSSALTFRADRGVSTNSGGIVVSEGAIVVTGDQSSTASVQSFQNGGSGHVDVVTEKDGVTTHESYDVSGGSIVGGGTTVPDTTPSRDDARPERPSR